MLANRRMRRLPWWQRRRVHQLFMEDTGGTIVVTPGSATQYTVRCPDCRETLASFTIYYDEPNHLVIGTRSHHAVCGSCHGTGIPPEAIADSPLAPYILGGTP